MASNIATASVSVLIGAALASGFEAAFGKATSKITAVGSALSALRQKSDELEGLKAAAAKAGSAADILSARWIKQKAAADRDAASVASLKVKIQESGDPTGKLGVKLDAIQQKALRSATAFQLTDTELTKAKAKFTETSAAAEKFATANAHVGSSLQLLETRMAAYDRSHAAVEANLQKRAKYQSGMIGVIAAAAGLRELVLKASEREEAVLHLKWALRSENPQQAVGEALKKAKEFARTSLATVPEMLKIEAVLSRERFDADVARMAAETAHKVSAVTEQDAEQTALVIGHVYNATREKMGGAPEEKFKRIGDLVTQLQHQFKFEGGVEDIGRQLSSALPVLESFHVPIEQAGAAMGVLAQQGLDAGKIPMVFSRLDAAAQKIGFRLAHNKQGGLDFIGTVDNMAAALVRTYGSVDRGRDAILKAFGARGGGGIMLALAANTRAVREEEERMARELPGVVGREYDELMGTAAAKLQVLKKNFESLLAPIGASLIPAFSAILTPIGKAAQALGEWMNSHQSFAKIIGTGAAALFTLSAATYAVGYAMTFVRHPFLKAIELYDLIRKTATAAAIAEELEGAAGGTGAAKMAGRLPILARVGKALLGIGTAGTTAAAGETAAGTAAAGAATGIGAFAAAAGVILGLLAEIAAAAVIVGKAFIDMRANIKRGFDEAEKQQLRKDIVSGKVKMEELRKAGFTDAQISRFIGYRGLNGPEDEIGAGKGKNGANQIDGLGVARARQLILGDTPEEQEKNANAPGVQIALPYANMRVTIKTPEPVGQAIEGVNPSQTKAVGQALSLPEGPLGYAAGTTGIKVIGSGGYLNDTEDKTPWDVTTGSSPKGAVVNAKKSKLATMPKAAIASQRAIGHLKIPKMAMGGLLTKETHFIGGEAGREAVIPLQRPAALLAIGAALAGALAAATPPVSPVFPMLPAIVRTLASSQRGLPADPSRIAAATETATVQQRPLSPVIEVLANIVQGRTEGAPRAEPGAPGNITVTNTFTINPAPGMDERKIGDICARKIDQTIRSSQMRRRGGNHD